MSHSQVVQVMVLIFLLPLVDWIMSSNPRLVLCISSSIVYTYHCLSVIMILECAYNSNFSSKSSCRAYYNISLASVGPQGILRQKYVADPLNETIFRRVSGTSTFGKLIADSGSCVR